MPYQKKPMKNEAETLNKVLKDTLEAEKKLKEEQTSAPNLGDKKKHEEAMSVDDGEEEGWKVQRKYLKKRSKNIKEDEKLYNCDQCDWKCKTMQELNVQRKVNHGESSTYECDKCQKVVKTKAELLEHAQSQHKESLGNQCERCEETFPSEEELKEHTCTTHQDKCFGCNKFDRKCKTTQELNEHIKMNHAENSATNVICVKKL